MIWRDGQVPRGYSRDLRERLLAMVESDLSVAEVAQRTEISPSSLWMWRTLAADSQPLPPHLPRWAAQDRAGGRSDVAGGPGGVPQPSSADVTFLVALGSTGMLAPCMFADAVYRALLVHWVRDWLVPTLPRGTTVVLGKLRVHRHADVGPALAVGCHLRYLPTYSPDVTTRSSWH